jgi:TfoX/Sxy family transcriptional regulator of competence genes
VTYDHGLVARIADALEQLGRRGTRQRNVFGGRGFMAGRHAFVIAWGDGLLAKLTPDDYALALAQPGVVPFTPGGERPMSTWVVVDADVIADDPELVQWIERALRAVVW